MLLYQSDFLNFIFIVISFALALILPFELFLFSYAFLGPMHYLTEINWLKSKAYFSKSKLPIYFIIGITLLISLHYINAYYDFLHFGIDKKLQKSLVTYLILSSFLFVLLTELFKNQFSKVKYAIIFIFLASILLTVLFLKNNYAVHIITFVFLPTLIHVFLFTFLFMWIGYLKKPSRFSLISCMLMLIIPFLIAFFPNQLFQEISSLQGFETYQNTSFLNLNYTISSFLDKQFEASTSFYDTIHGIKIQSFIAFAYTYHYLNWFSKINVIGWAKSISKVNLFTVMLLWTVSVALYLYDFKLGLMVLFFMSLGHVLLEFPLNIVVVKGIYKHYQSKLKLSR